MLLVLSGEGATDIGGSKDGSDECGLDAFAVGPLALLICREIERQIDYSPLHTGLVFWVSKLALSKIARSLRRSPEIAFPGAKSEKEMLAHVRAAEALALRAKEIETRESCPAVAVLFHDSDGTRADSPSRWQHVVDAIDHGFTRAGFLTGVAMVPRPKQEAWFVCGLKLSPYNGCDALELASGNDNSPNDLKTQLEECLRERATTEKLFELVESGAIDWDRISMPSFRRFKNSLVAAVEHWRSRGGFNSESQHAS
jgi:hypothetical protein